jgi:hypothetical protein
MGLPAIAGALGPTCLMRIPPLLLPIVACSLSLEPSTMPRQHTSVADDSMRRSNGLWLVACGLVLGAWWYGRYQYHAAGACRFYDAVPFLGPALLFFYIEIQLSQTKTLYSIVVVQTRIYVVIE